MKEVTKEEGGDDWPRELRGVMRVLRLGKSSTCEGSETWLGRRRRGGAGKDDAVAIRLRRLEGGLLQDAVREVGLLGSLRHGAIAEWEWWGVEGGVLVGVSQVAEFGSVTDAIERGFPGGLPEATCAAVLSSVLEALAYLHGRHGIIHRGVRASHVLLFAHSAKLSGFRHALRLPAHTRVTHDFGPHLRANLLWLAPEILAQGLDGYDAASDLYSLGVLAVEAANGFAPFSDMDLMQMFMEKLRGTIPRLLDTRTAAPESPHKSFRARRFSQAFHAFTDVALSPLAQRASLAQLQSHAFFGQVKRSKGGLKSHLQPILSPITLASPPTMLAS